ncbi:MAG: polysaccharide biosynthesis/export family protein [Pyrinomonadaceae bacterium]|nr:polysaccharide biosynthesis/export family protein [Pyrinomonadaceae bacterium]
MKKFLCVMLLCIIPAVAAQAQGRAARSAHSDPDTKSAVAPNRERTSPASNAATSKASTAPALSPRTANDSSNPRASTTSINNSSTNASTAPVAAVTTDALTNIYRVGAGDVLDIRVLNYAVRQPTLYTVMEGGLLEFPLAGEPFVVAGLTIDEIDARLSSELKRRAVFVNPRVVVSVREYVSHTVVVSGLVSNPGAKILRREAVPLFALLAEAQAHAEAARATIMSSITQASSTIELDESSGINTLVRAGDVITVRARPPQFYFIGGQVSAPGQKNFYNGLTLLQAILASGGTTRYAGTNARISRSGADGRLILTVHNLKDIKNGKAPDPVLQPGDRIELSRRRWQ